jgi:glutamine synthetase
MDNQMNIKDRMKANEHVLKLAKQQDIKFIRLWFTDILGFLKSFSITFEELETALELGSGFDGSSIQGFARIDESDLVASPDPTTLQILPWRPKEHKTARMFRRSIKLPGCFAIFVGLEGSLLKVIPDMC